MIIIGLYFYILYDLSPSPSPCRRGEPESLVPPSLAGKGVRGLGFSEMWQNAIALVEVKAHRYRCFSYAYLSL